MDEFVARDQIFTGFSRRPGSTFGSDEMPDDVFGVHKVTGVCDFCEKNPATVKDRVSGHKFCDDCLSSLADSRGEEREILEWSFTPGELVKTLKDIPLVGGKMLNKGAIGSFLSFGAFNKLSCYFGDVHVELSPDE